MLEHESRSGIENIEGINISAEGVANITEANLTESQQQQLAELLNNPNVWNTPLELDTVGSVEYGGFGERTDIARFNSTNEEDIGFVDTELSVDDFLSMQEDMLRQEGYTPEEARNALYAAATEDIGDLVDALESGDVDVPMPHLEFGEDGNLRRNANGIQRALAAKKAGRDNIPVRMVLNESKSGLSAEAFRNTYVNDNANTLPDDADITTGQEALLSDFGADIKPQFADWEEAKQVRKELRELESEYGVQILADDDDARYKNIKLSENAPPAVRRLAHNKAKSNRQKYESTTESTQSGQSDGLEDRPIPKFGDKPADQFAHLQEANEFRDELIERYGEDVLAKSDKRNTTEVKLAADAPDKAAEGMRQEAADDRERAEPTPRAELTREEKKRLDFSERSIFHAEYSKGVILDEGISDWTSVYDPQIEKPAGHRDTIESSRKGTDMHDSPGTNTRGKNLDNQDDDVEMSRREAEGKMETHAVDAVKNGVEEAEDTLKSDFGWSEDEVEMIRNENTSEEPTGNEAAPDNSVDDKEDTQQDTPTETDGDKANTANTTQSEKQTTSEDDIDNDPKDETDTPANDSDNTNTNTNTMGMDESEFEEVTQDIQSKIDEEQSQDEEVEIEGQSGDATSKAVLENGRNVYLKNASEDDDNTITKRARDQELAGEAVSNELVGETVNVSYDEDSDTLVKEEAGGKEKENMSLKDDPPDEWVEKVDKEEYVKKAAAQMVAGNNDVRKGNIHITEDGDIRIIDFDNAGVTQLREGESDDRVMMQLTMDSTSASRGADEALGDVNDEFEDMADFEMGEDHPEIAEEAVRMAKDVVENDQVDDVVESVRENLPEDANGDIADTIKQNIEVIAGVDSIPSESNTTETTPDMDDNTDENDRTVDDDDLLDF